MRPADPHRPLRLQGDDGAALVEVAFVAPVLLLFFMAILEYGMLYRDYLNVSSAASDAAKYGSIQGPSPTTGNVYADYTIVSWVRQNIASMPIDSIDRIVVFKAGPSSYGKPLAQVPSVCKTGSTSTSAKCNVYRIAGVPMSSSAFVQMEVGNSDFFECNAAGEPACGWPPPSRKNGPKSSDIDYLGVYIKINRKKISGMIPMSNAVEVAAIARLEPGVFE